MGPTNFRSHAILLTGYNITELSFRWQPDEPRHLMRGVATRVGNEGEGIASRLCAGGFQVWGIGHDGLDKTHARHMVGASTVQEE